MPIVTVSPEDIRDNATNCDAFRGPINDAIRRAFDLKDGDQVCVRESGIVITRHQKGITEYDTPREVRDWLHLWDMDTSRHLCEAFEFEL